MRRTKTLIKNVSKVLGVSALFFLWSGFTLLTGQAKHRNVAATTEPPSSDKIIQFIREKFGVGDKVSMVLNPFHSAADPEFMDSTVAVDDGQNTKNSKRSTEISVSKDGRLLVISSVPPGNPGSGTFLPLGADVTQEISHRVHEVFRVPENITVSATTLRSSAFPEFYATTITADDGKGKPQTLEAFVTHDHRFLILGSVYNLGVDPRREALRLLVLQNQPTAGPKDAPVTIVEFADLECPTCARAHEFLEKNLLPTYTGKVRVIFKEFPLPFHEWAMPAAIADQCAYRINPPDYLPYRTLVFQHQGEFEAIKANASAVRDKLLDYGQEAGIDKVQLAGCVDSKASLPKIEANMKEGKTLDVNSTPTFFINGRIMVGADPEPFIRPSTKLSRKQRRRSNCRNLKFPPGDFAFLLARLPSRRSGSACHEDAPRV